MTLSSRVIVDMKLCDRKNVIDAAKVGDDAYRVTISTPCPDAKKNPSKGLVH